MGLQKKVEDVLNKIISEKPSLFVIDLSISSSNHISIQLDGDQGVKLQDCIDISKAIESELENDEFDHSLEVTSCGAESPMKNVRQLPKNIGRTVAVKQDHRAFEAQLIDVKENILVLEWQTREPKATGKGKQTVEHLEEIPFENIKEVKVKITFN